MAAPSIPQNFYAQQGNGQVYLVWDLVAGASSYAVLRSTDNVTFSTISSPINNFYLDSTVTINTQYYYKVQGFNGDGLGLKTNAQGVVPTLSGQLSLGQIRLMGQFKADRVNSNFVTLPEWNMNINQSAFELYNLLIDVYEDYFSGTPCTFTTDGVNSQFDLPTNFYKLLGVDAGVGGQFVTLKKFAFIDRNKNTYFQSQNNSSILSNLRYRLVGNTIMFNAIPGANQTIKIWYAPRMTQLLRDIDVLDGVNGWSEYVIVDSAIKALQKEESDISALELSKERLIERIKNSAPNRDAGQPEVVSDTRSAANGSEADPFGWM